MLNYSQIIKNERIKQNMTQQALAKGICSTSYLSKIEKEHVIPRDHIREALLKKLNLNTHYLKMSQEEEFLRELHRAFQYAIHLNSAEHAQIVWNHFNEFNIEFSTRENFYQCNLYLQRIAIIAKQPILDLDEISEAFASVLNNLNPEQLFIFYVNSCHYCLENRLYKDAMKFMSKAEKVIQDYEPEIPEWLIGNFHFISSQLTYTIHHYSAAFSHAHLALTIFEKLNLQTPIINCYIQIGICNNRSGLFEYAKKALQTAYHLAVQLEKKELYGTILQQLGQHAALTGESKEAIQYYRESLEHTVSVEPKLAAIHHMIKEYSKLNQPTFIQYWCKKGIQLVSEHLNTPFYRTFYFQFRFYQMLHHIESLKPDVIEEAITYFEECEELILVQKYAIAFGHVFYEQQSFEDAAKLYKKANEVALTIQRRNYWQDL